MEPSDLLEIRHRLDSVERRLSALEELTGQTRPAGSGAAAQRAEVLPPPAWPAQQPGAAGTRPAPPARVWTAADLEALLSGQGLAWAGGLAVLAGAVFFLGLAFARGWIGPAGRVSIGLSAAVLMVAVGVWCFGRREALFGHVLAAVGLGTAGISLFAATRLYGFVPPSAALVAMGVLAAVTTVTALRVSSQTVAVYSLIAALAAPPLFDAPADAFTIAFLGVVLAGVAAIAQERSWLTLATAGFWLSAPQLWSWLEGGAALLPGLVALGAFWTVHTAAAGPAHEYRRSSARLLSLGLLVSNAAFVTVAGLAVLDMFVLVDRSGSLLLAVGLAHMGLGAYILATRGREHPYGLGACAVGVLALVCAAAAQWDGAPVTVAWALGAVALAEACRRWTVRYSRGAAVGLGALTVIHLLLVDLPLDQRLQVHLSPDIRPLLGSGALAALVASAAALLGIDRLLGRGAYSRWLRLAAGGLGVYGLSLVMIDLYSGLAAAGSVDAIRKLAQVSLSILWALIGGAAFVAGVVRWNSVLRWSGLGLFSAAAAKVFLYDLASLDATYKVPSLVGLGLLMLASSYAYQRLRPAAPSREGAG